MADEQYRIKKIISLLTGQYGYREWKLQKDTIGVLVLTILSQNTSDTNSHRAYSSLRRQFSSWVAVANAPAAKIARSIKHGGLSQVKARYIRDALKQIIIERNELDLDFLKQMTPADARNWLIKLPGVGLKTANVVLLFSLGMPVMPVDTHVFRVSRRLGLIDDKTQIDMASEILEQQIPEEQMYAFHILIIDHGRKICIARRPRCRMCVLGSICPSYPIFTFENYSKGRSNQSSLT